MGPERSYRGKRLDNKKWWYGSYLFLHVRDRDWTGKEVGKAEDVHYIVDDQGINYAVSPDTIGLDTGLTDKNGVKIFEGDILQTKYGRLCSVRWFESSSVLCFDQKPINIAENILKKAPDEWDLWNEENIEVVGNIHDNPELLEVQNGTTDMET